MTTTPSTSAEVRRRPAWDIDPWAGLAPWSSQLQALMRELWPSTMIASDFSPGGELHETDEAFILELDLPGVDKEEVSIGISDRRISVSGTKRVTERKGVLRHSTRVTGSFAFEAVLATAVKEDAVTAALTDGVLTVTLPKATESKARHVDIR